MEVQQGMHVEQSCVQAQANEEPASLSAFLRLRSALENRAYDTADAEQLASLSPSGALFTSLLKALRSLSKSMLSVAALSSKAMSDPATAMWSDGNAHLRRALALAQQIRESSSVQLGDALFQWTVYAGRMYALYGAVYLRQRLPLQEEWMLQLWPRAKEAFSGLSSESALEEVSAAERNDDAVDSDSGDEEDSGDGAISKRAITEFAGRGRGSHAMYATLNPGMAAASSVPAADPFATIAVGEGGGRKQNAVLQVAPPSPMRRVRSSDNLSGLQSSLGESNAIEEERARLEAQQRTEEQHKIARLRRQMFPFMPLVQTDMAGVAAIRNVKEALQTDSNNRALTESDIDENAILALSFGGEGEEKFYLNLVERLMLEVVFAFRVVTPTSDGMRLHRASTSML